MKVKINGRDMRVSVFNYLKANRIDKHIARAKQIIGYYNLCNELRPIFECHNSIILYAEMRYRAASKTNPYGVFIFNGKFDESKFIANVIKPYW